MNDYWLTQEILRASGFGFIALALLGIGLALWLPKTRTGKARALAVVAILIAIPMSQVVRGVVEAREFAARRDKAKTMWQERCKTAGEKIHKTVENVEAIYLMKLRTTTNFGNQFELDDPYGHDSTDKEYILNFLPGFYHQRNEPIVAGSPPRTGYAYVEAQDPKDGKRYRYTGGMKVVGQKDVNHPNIQRALKLDSNFDVNNYAFVLDKVPAPTSPPRFGVTYDDISTHEEREYWIAGSSLKVIDLQTNEVIAERVGYMVDLAQGSTAGQRSPWLFAADNACPGFQWNPNFPVTRSTGGGATEQPGQTLIFVEKVLKPSK